MDRIFERISYLKGVVDGVELNGNSKETVLISELIDLVEILSEAVNENVEQIEDLEEYVEFMDEDLADLEDDIYDYDFEEYEIEDHVCDCCSSEECDE